MSDQEIIIPEDLTHDDGHVSGSPATYRIYQRKLDAQVAEGVEPPKEEVEKPKKTTKKK